MTSFSVHFSEITLLLNLQGLFAISPDHLGQDSDIGAEEGEALEPDEQEGVVTLKLQHVGRQQPRALSEPPQHATWNMRSLATLMQGFHSCFRVLRAILGTF